MNDYYKNYLKQFNILSEDKFNDIISNLPSIIKNNLDFSNLDDVIDGDPEDNLGYALFNNYFSKNSEDASVEYLDFSNKEISVWKISTNELNKLIEDLDNDWKVIDIEEIKLDNENKN